MIITNYLVSRPVSTLRSLRSVQNGASHRPPRVIMASGNACNHLWYLSAVSKVLKKAGPRRPAPQDRYRGDVCTWLKCVRFRIAPAALVCATRLPSALAWLQVAVMPLTSATSWVRIWTYLVGSPPLGARYRSWQFGAYTCTRVTPSLAATLTRLSKP